MAIPEAITVKEVIENNIAAYDDQLLSNVGGYVFSLIKDDGDACWDWYIKVNPEGEGFLYDGWWHESSDKTLEEAISEALRGAEI